MMSLFKKCAHDWLKVSETVLPSGLEQLLATKQVSEVSVSSYLVQKSHIVVLTCKKCGKVHKEVTVNP